MHQQEIQFTNRYSLSVEEASTYFHIGEGKMRKLISENKDADYILWNGNRAQIKRTLFEQYLDKCNTI